MDRCFACGIGSGAGASDLSAHAGNVHNAAGLFDRQPMTGSSTTQEKRAVQIDVDDFAPLGGIKVDNVESIRPPCCACVIDDDVDAAKLFERSGNECIDGGVIGS